MKPVSMKLIPVCIVLFGLIQPFANANDRDSGGGTTVVCREKGTDRVTSARLLDLYEWPESNKLKIPHVAATGDDVVDQKLLDEQIKLFLGQSFMNKDSNISLKRVLTHNIQVVKDAFAKALTRADTEYKNTYITAQLDIGMAKSVRVPKGCKLEPAVFYSAPTVYEGDFDIDSEIWHAMSITDRLGLLVHESVYAIQRAFFDDRDSFNTRKYTAELIALVSASENDSQLYAMFNHMSGYRRILASKWGTGPLVKLSIKEGQRAKVRIKLINEKKSDKVVQEVTVNVSAGDKPEEIRLKTTYLWTKLEMTLVSSKDNAHVAVTVLSTDDNEILTWGSLSGEDGYQAHLFAATIQSGSLVHGKEGRVLAP